MMSCPWYLKTYGLSLTRACRQVKNYYGSCLCKQVQLVRLCFFWGPYSVNPNNLVDFRCFVTNYCLIFLCLLVPVNVYVPKDRVTNAHQGYGFVEFRSEEDADYVIFFTSNIIKTTTSISLSQFWFFDYQFFLQAIKVLNMLKLFGKPIRVNKVCCMHICYVQLWLTLVLFHKCWLIRDWLYDPIIWTIGFTR